MTSKAVNRPTDVKTKERDINNKLQLYGIFSAFAAGKVPSNSQIDVALNSVLASRGFSSPSKRLSPEGQKLVADLKDVIEKAKILVLTKNEGNLLQDFIWQTQQVSGGNASTPNAPIDKGTAQQHGNEALEGLRTLGTLIISNGQFRKLLSDAQILLRDIAGDAASKAANKVNPSEGELNQIDRPAEDNTWHDTPDLSRENLKNKARSKYNEQKPFDRNEARGALGDATQQAHPTGSRDPADAADLAARDQERGTASGMDAQQGARAGYDSLKQKARENMPDDTQDQARNYRDRTNNYLKDKMPQERREQTIWRLKKMVVEIQSHSDYQQAIDTLLNLAEQYQGHAQNLAQQSTGAVKGAHTDNSLQLAEADLKTLIERFANSTSTDDLFDSINAIYRDADQDPELKGWFRDMDRYVRRCLKEQGYIMRDQATDEWNELYDRGHFLLRDRYRAHTDHVVDELKFMADQFDKDPQNKAFGDSIQKLFLDLGNDENGKPTFKPHLIKDLTDVIIPAFFENVRYVPIPRIEYTDPMMDAIVENLVIESDNLAPNVAEVASDNFWRWGRKSITSKRKNKVMLSVSGIQMDLKDVSYYVKKKQGFPSVTDKGVCDIFLGGQGLSFKVDMETADDKMRQHFFKVNKVDISIKNFNIKMKQSNHKLLFNIFKPLLLKVVRPAIVKALEKVIKDKINQVDGMMYSVYREAETAKEDAKRHPDQAQNIYQRYANAANKKFMQGKQKKDEVASDKKVNVAVTQHDSIFKNISLPGGISSKATDYKELALKGDKWTSPVFSIGSAKETTNLPKVPSVSRKHHSTRDGGIRGPQNLDRSEATGFGTGVGSQTDREPAYNSQPTYGNANGSYNDTGYGNNTTGYANNSYTDTNGPTAFSKQVNDAFDGNTYPQQNGGSHQTSLGSKNPVLTGAV